MSQSQDPILSNMGNSKPSGSFTWTKLSYEPKESIQTKNMNSDILIVCF